VSKQKLTPTYVERRDRLKATFPAAHAFLTALEDDDRLWLSTATNAHIYSGDRFLAYVKIHAPELEPPSVLLSPHYNQRIAEGAEDASRSLFDAAMGELLGQPEDWWVRRAGGVVELTSATPQRFFSELLDALRRV